MAGRVLPPLEEKQKKSKQKAADVGPKAAAPGPQGGLEAQSPNSTLRHFPTFLIGEGSSVAAVLAGDGNPWR